MIGQRSALIVDVVAASMIAAIDQHIADAGCAHFAEGDFVRVVVMVGGVSSGLYGRQYVPMFLCLLNHLRIATQM